MSIVERLMGIGGWSLRLHPETPPSVLDAVDLATESFGHVIVTPTHVDVNGVSGDTLMSVARYTGVLRSRPNLYELGGPGLAMWLADEDSKGDVIETALSKTAGTFVQWVTDLRPTSLDAGTYTAIAGSLTHTFEYVDRRTALDYVCDYFDGEWKILPTGALHCGPQATLFTTTTPTAVIQKRSGGRDLDITGIRTDLSLDTDMDDYTTRVVLLASGLAAGRSVGTADISPATTYRDVNGNLVEFTRIIESSDTQSGNENSVATAQLNRFTAQRRAVTLSGDIYDIGDDVAAGDTVYVYDPDLDLVDTANQVQYRGQMIFPITLRVLGYTWPVRRGMGVYFRAPDAGGTITDLSDWVQWETGNTSIEVGAKPRATDSDPSTTALVRPAALGPGGELGYAQVTANQGSITTITDLTNMTKTVSIGQNRRIKITVHAEFSSTVSTDQVESYIFEGANQLQRCSRVVGANLDTHHFSITLTPSAGSHTYKARAARTVGTGTVTLNAAATREAFLAIEDVGSAV